MNVYLMRHGLAVERGTPGYNSDEERPLTPKGERKVLRVADALLKLEISFDAILSSPLLRAKQTAALLSREMKSKQKVQLTEHLAPGGNVKKLVYLIHHLRVVPENVLLVGHEPDLGELTAALLAGSKQVAIAFKKAGVAKLAVESLRAGQCATLEWLLTPRQLEMMA